MKVTAERDENRQVVLNVELEEERVAKALDRAYRRVVGRVNVPGFRRGKAPRYLVERMLGKEALYEEAAKELIPAAFQEAVESEKIEAFAEPEFEITQYEPLAFKAVVPLPPTVELGDYKSLRGEPEKVEIGDDEVEQALKQLQDQNSTWEEPETVRPAQKGDQLLVDLETFRDGQAQGKSEDYVVNLGQGTILPELDEQLTGMEIGQTKEIKVTMPEDHPDEEIRNKELTFNVLLKGIKERHAPELNDEFAKSVGEVDTMDELRQRVRENLTARAEAAAKERFADWAVKAVVDQAKIEMPPVVIDGRVVRLMENFEESLKPQRITLEQYLNYVNKTREEFEADMRPRAVEQLKTALVLREVGKAEGVSVEPQEIDAKIDTFVQQQPDADGKLRESLDVPEIRDSLQSSLYEEKIVGRLMEIATQGEEGAPEVAESGDGEAKETAVAEESRVQPRAKRSSSKSTKPAAEAEDQPTS